MSLSLPAFSLGALSAKVAGGSVVAPTLPHFKAAVAGVKAGTRRATVLVIGDSTTAGFHGGDSGSDFTVNQRNRAWPAVFSASLASAGVPALCNSIMGDSGYYKYSGSNFAQTMNGFAGNYSGQSVGDATRRGLGGSPFIMGSGGYVGITPPTTCNTMKVFYQTPTVATAASQVGSATQKVTSLDGTDEALVTDFASLGTAAASTTCAAAWSSGGAVAVQGLYGYDSATPAVDVINAGIIGSVVADWAEAQTAHSYLNSIKSVAPDLTIIAARINDMNAGTSLSAFTASLTAVVTEALKYGDVLLVNDAAVNNAGSGVASKAVSDTYTTAIKQVANSLSLAPVTDLETAIGPYDASLYYDDLHPLKARYAAMGQKVAADVLSYIA